MSSLLVGEGRKDGKNGTASVHPKRLHKSCSIDTRDVDDHFVVISDSRFSKRYIALTNPKRMSSRELYREGREMAINSLFREKIDNYALGYVLARHRDLDDDKAKDFAEYYSENFWGSDQTLLDEIADEAMAYADKMEKRRKSRQGIMTTLQNLFAMFDSSTICDALGTILEDAKPTLHVDRLNTIARRGILSQKTRDVIIEYLAVYIKTDIIKAFIEDCLEQKGIEDFEYSL